MRSYLKEYYKRNKAKSAAAYKARYQADKDAIKSKIKQWGLNNPDKIRLYRRRQAEKSNIRRKKWAKNNPEHLKRYLAEYKKAHRSDILHYNQVRRALQRKATVNLAGLKQFVRSVRAKENANCYYCNASVRSIEVHFDHIIPLHKGGQHSADNLCVSCWRCNLSKATKCIGEWMPIGQQLLSL